jgi:UDP-N-acetylglucosamine--N-acetylmuramyl-(pentapeptide) pyrophosphoryl-undecaprenol N-acetylglucosamine transferase
MSGAPLVLLAAGGTGGHLFPAEALAHALLERGARIHLATDTRAAAYAEGGKFPAEAVHALPAATPSGGGIASKLRAGLVLARGVLAGRSLAQRLKPAITVGFGGYPSVPAVMGASLAGMPTIIHEQNAVLGRANRFLSGRATLIATGFSRVKGAESVSQKLRHVGNPVRPAVVAASGTPWSPPETAGTVRLLVFGGSQGARVMADIVPPALALVPAVDAARLVVVQQARTEDEARVAAAYAASGVKAELAPFFNDLPQRMADAHLVIGRSGASTVAELGVIGRGAILVPLPGSLDQDQAANAQSLADIGAAIRILQPDFTPERLAGELTALLHAPERLTAMAEAAKSAGIPDAASRLADLVLATARAA